MYITLIHEVEKASNFHFTVKLYPLEGIFDAITSVDEFIIYDSAQYTRRDWRNRNQIKTPTGPQWLTIECQVKNKYTQAINEVMVASKSWGENHWKAILHNYSRAKNFSYFEQHFSQLYLGNLPESLSEINEIFLLKVCQLLGIKTRIRRDSDFSFEGDRTEKLVQICQQAGATDYYTGPSAKDYINEGLFNSVGIQVHYYDYSGYRPYTQLFGSFIHEVSIVDLLCNEGPNANEYLKNHSEIPTVNLINAP